MSYDNERIPQILRDLKVDTLAIPEAREILNLRRDGKWSLRLLLLAYLLKEDELQTIKSLVDFAFSKRQEESLYRRFEFRTIQSPAMMPEKWFSKQADDTYLPGAKYARSILGQWPGLFEMQEKKYRLNASSGARKLALVLLISFLAAHGIRISDIARISSSDRTEEETRLYQRLFLLGSDGSPTPIVKEIEEMPEGSLLLAQEIDIDKESKDVMSRIQGILIEALQRHHVAFSVPPMRQGKLIQFKPIYQLSAFSDSTRQDIKEWMRSLTTPRSDRKNESEEEDIEESYSPVVLLGGAGSGKSCWIAQAAAQMWNRSFEAEEAKRTDEQVPILLELGLVSIDKMTQGNVLLFGNERLLLWSEKDEPDKATDQSLIVSALDAMLGSRHSSQYLRKIIDRVDWHKKEFVVFLDGWDELGSGEKKEMARFVEALCHNHIPCIVASRSRDGYLDSLDSAYYVLEQPSPDDCREYLHHRGMEQKLIDNLSQWLPRPSPLDLEILGRVPKMEEISRGRIPVYRTWVELQVLSCAGIEVPAELHSRSELDNIIERGVFRDRPLSEWIRGRGKPYSVWNLLPHLAYSQKEGTHTSHSYNRVLEENPLLSGLLSRQTGSGDSPHPEISRNHLVPYLSAEYAFREYLEGRYKSLLGDSQAFEFLTEILSYDPERRHEPELVQRNSELNPTATASMICLESESVAFRYASHSISARTLAQSDTRPSTAFYDALFQGFVRYWALASDPGVRRTVLDAFTNLIQANILEAREDNPVDYIIPVLEIEEAIKGIHFAGLTTNKPNESVDLPVRDSAGYVVTYLDYNKMQEALVEIALRRPWLTPWIVRVIEKDKLSRIVNIIESVPDQQVIHDVFSYASGVLTQIPDEWLQVLHKSANRLKSGALWNLLAYFLLRNGEEMKDSILSLALQTLASSEASDSRKLELVTRLRQAKLSSQQMDTVWKLTMGGELSPRFGMAVCLSQDLPELSIDDIFRAISEGDELGWLRMLVPGIFQEKYDEEEVNRRFSRLGLSTVRALPHVGVPPWDQQRMNQLIDFWWKKNLRTVDDALKLIRGLSKMESIQVDSFVMLDYRATDVLERIAIWLRGTRDATRRRFFLGLIESGIDMTDLSVREYFHPIYKEIKDREDLDELLVERYPSYLRGMLTLPLSRESWIKHINKVGRTEILEWDWLMEIYLEAGNVTSIAEAIHLLDEILNNSGDLIETFDTLSEWILRRPKNYIAAFALYLLQKNPASSRFGYWSRVEKRGILQALSPTRKTSPEVYDRIFEAAKEMLGLPINHRSELQFLFELLSPEDQLEVVRPHIDALLGKEPLFFKTSLEELLFLHGDNKDLKRLVQSLNDDPRPLGNVWLKDNERSKVVSKSLTHPLSKIFYETDIAGGWEEYKKELEKSTQRAEACLLVLLENDWRGYGYSYLTSGMTLRNIALKHWKRMFLRDESRIREWYLGDLFQEDNEEILEFIGGEIDRIHKEQVELSKEEPKAHRSPWYSWIVYPLSKISEKHGYSGLRKLLPYVKERHAVEGVVTYLAAAAKRERIPISEILALEEFHQLSKESKWHLLSSYGEKIKSG